MASGGAVAAAVAIPVVVGGGGLAVYFLVREDAPVSTPSYATNPYSGGDPLGAAVDALAGTVIREGGRVASKAAKEVGSFIEKNAKYHPAVLAYRGTKQVVGDVSEAVQQGYSDIKGAAGTVYGDVRSGIGAVYNGTTTVVKTAAQYHPVTLSYKTAVGTVSLAKSSAKTLLNAGGNAVSGAKGIASDVASGAKKAVSKLKFW